VEKVDKEKNIIVYKKVEDLKGKHKDDVIHHTIGKNGLHPREWQYVMEWAEAGKTAVFMHNGTASETCIGNYWYQSYAEKETWTMGHGQPYLLSTFYGKAEDLAAALKDVLAGKEVIVPYMTSSKADDLALRKGKVLRMKASLKLTDYNPKRDTVNDK